MDDTHGRAAPAPGPEGDEALSKKLATAGICAPPEKIDAMLRRRLGLRVTSVKRLEPAGMVNAVYFVSAVSVGSAADADADTGAGEGSVDVSAEKENEHELVVRLTSTREARWRGCKTRHEVACLRLLADRGVPVPAVLCHSDTPDEIGFEYIVMPRARGERLGDVYPALALHDKEAVVRSIGRLVQRMRGASDADVICGFAPRQPSGESADGGSERAGAAGDDADDGVAVPAGIVGLAEGAVFSKFREYAAAQIASDLADLAGHGDARWVGFLKPLARHADRHLHKSDSGGGGDGDDDGRPFVFTHSDLNSDNLLVAPDTLELTLLDLEWAGMRPAWWEDFDDLELEDDDAGLTEERVRALMAEGGLVLPPAEAAERHAPVCELINTLCHMLHHADWHMGRPAADEAFCREIEADLRELVGPPEAA